ISLVCFNRLIMEFINCFLFVLFFFVFCYMVLRKNASKSIRKFMQVCNRMDYIHQTVESTEENGAVIRSSKHRKMVGKGFKNVDGYSTHYFEGTDTMYSVVVEGAKRSPDGRCLGKINKTRTGVEWISYRQVLVHSKNLASGLLWLGLEPGVSTFGIYSANCPEYTITEHACYRHSLAVVPIHGMSDIGACAFIANQTKLTAIFCDTLLRAKSVIENATQFKTLRHIIVAAQPGSFAYFEEMKQEARSAGLSLHSMSA